MRNFVFGVILIFLGFITNVNAQSNHYILKGKISNQVTGELLSGANIRIKGVASSIARLDGSYVLKNIPSGKYKVSFQYVGYLEKDTVISIDENNVMNILLTPLNTNLNTLTVFGTGDHESDAYARNKEKNAANIVNIISAKTIELSPDITVGNVLQRVSGVSVERGSSGDGRYVIIRGMDKRYNYTLVNGIKIPSPDNKNRYVPLDIFPADLIERVEVNKTLTPNMEGDAIGGTVNMIMKSAPNKFYFNGSASTGYSQTFFNKKFDYFPVSAIHQKSPYELNGSSYAATPTDFTRDNLNFTPKQASPNAIATLSIGNRFFKNKLGIMVGASYQNTYKGYRSLYMPADYLDGNLLVVKNVNIRDYSLHSIREGLNVKIDYTLNKSNKISLYNLYTVLQNAESRLTIDSLMPPPRTKPGTGQIWYFGRSKYQKESIYNSTLQGVHQLINERLKLKWSAVFSKATNRIPDWAEYEYDGGFYTNPSTPNAAPYTHPNIAQDFNRQWWRNNDRDLAGYLDLNYTNKINSLPYTLSVGGLYRDKKRDNYYDNYLLKPTLNNDGTHQEWTNIYNLQWTVFNPQGSAAAANNYRASENVAAGYAMLNIKIKKLEAVGGVRLENTTQHFDTNVPVTQAGKTGDISYMDVLPSISFKYLLNDKTNLRLSYFSSINRPGYFEIVPYRYQGDDWDENGNPDLKHTTAQNLDFRYEYFPRANEQLLLGAFYKKLENPIEYGFNFTGSQSHTVYQPNNYGNATNYGFEFVYEKYIGNFGIRANYTYTNSSISTTKFLSKKGVNGSEEFHPIEKRPLQGQAAHIANFALLYKNQLLGIDAQINWQYTGKNIVLVSPYYEFDYWQKGMSLFDFSAEKKFAKKFSVFVKVKNLLNAKYEVYVNQPVSNAIAVPFQNPSSGKALAQRSEYGQNYQLGLRYKF
ncbi:TonB-dependent receptor domain-containing protein [Arachidicoccus soli]|uniref:TonB-dependent receptor n=1 Tax=Arachidicoccus soli TaxID=2341117 RepID=A0A386HNG1_9BACT|nr:TonB-dependent receptor [Arachidicoccus soli]AYD47050.1 TonB-dependent receptor [Arachidicoccus soli]